MTTLVAVYTTRAGQTSTHFATALAWTLAEENSVLLVDCDMEGGTIADLLLLATGSRSVANCFGDRPTATAQLAAQAVPHPRRAALRVVPGISHNFGYEVSECLHKLAPALRGSAEDFVVADLGHPLSHPGLRSPRTSSDAISAVFGRVFVVIRDEPALLARSISVLSAAQPAHAEIILCRQSSRTYRNTVGESLRQALPDMPVRDVWGWDADGARRVLETGTPQSLPGVAADLSLVAAEKVAAEQVPA